MSFFKRMANAVETVGKDVSKAAKDTTEISRYTASIEECRLKMEET